MAKHLTRQNKIVTKIRKKIKLPHIFFEKWCLYHPNPSSIYSALTGERE
jgi:hypothetical protein